MMNTVVAMFESSADATRAADILMDEGFRRDEIEIRTHGLRAEAGAERDEGESWWSWLFGESEESRNYTEGLGSGRALLAVTTSEPRAERARIILEGATDAEVRTEAGPSGTEPRPSPAEAGHRARTPGDDEVTMPVVEERMRVGKRPVARGGVRVYTRTHEEPVEEQVPLREEHVRVDRRPVDRPLTDADARAAGEQEIEMTETAEEPVIAKEARVVEEVSVGKDVEEHVETVHDTVRRSDVEVERLGADAETGQGAAERFGAMLGRDPQLGAGDWATTAPEARRLWESRNPGTWDRVEAAIRSAWESARGRRAA